MVGVLLFQYKITSSLPARCTSWELCGDRLEQRMERGVCAHRGQAGMAEQPWGWRSPGCSPACPAQHHCSLQPGNALGSAPLVLTSGQPRICLSQGSGELRTLEARLCRALGGCTHPQQHKGHRLCHPHSLAAHTAGWEGQPGARCPPARQGQVWGTPGSVSPCFQSRGVPAVGYAHCAPFLLGAPGPGRGSPKPRWSLEGISSLDNLMSPSRCSYKGRDVR